MEKERIHGLMDHNTLDNGFKIILMDMLSYLGNLYFS